MRMSPFLEMPVESLPPLVNISTTNLARILDAQSVEFVEPVRNRLSVPSKRKFEGVIDLLLLFLYLFVDDLDILNVLKLSKRNARVGKLVSARSRVAGPAVSPKRTLSLSVNACFRSTFIRVSSRIDDNSYPYAVIYPSLKASVLSFFDRPGFVPAGEGSVAPDFWASEAAALMCFLPVKCAS